VPNIAAGAIGRCSAQTATAIAFERSGMHSAHGRDEPSAERYAYLSGTRKLKYTDRKCGEARSPESKNLPGTNG